MKPDRDALDDILSSIADGRPVDWQTAEKTVSTADRSLLDTLGDVSRIAAFSRSLQEGGATLDSGLPKRWCDLLLLERLSSGERSELYRAWDIKLEREVAVKLLRADYARENEVLLLKESRIAAKVRHPNVITVHGSDVGDGRPGFWMDFLRGSTLEQEVNGGGPLDVAHVLVLGSEIGSALTAVHEAGLLHRDIKPSNIIRDGERYVLGDFGLGQRAGDVSPLESRSGTPMYMAPELFHGAAPTTRSDVYALGLTLWFALVGRHPFQAISLDELIAAIGMGTPAVQSIAPHVPPALASVIEKSTAFKPEDRFASARELSTALENAAATLQATQKRSLFRVPGLVLGGLLAASVIALVITDRRAHPPAHAVPAQTENAEPTIVPTPAAYDVQVTFLKHTPHGAVQLMDGNRVQPGDKLSLETRVSRPAWVYVLNEDEHGEHYLLFPQPRFDQKNPISADGTHALPGAIEGRENAWTVTSRGGREYLLVVVSPKPVPELESSLGQIPPATPGHSIEYARVGTQVLETLRGVGGVEALPKDEHRATTSAAASHLFDHFRALAGQESGVQGVWIRQIQLENP
jgi:serine/threonine protein kinase